MNGIYWLASYPKSGNTWLRVLLTNYRRDGDEPADINDLDINAEGFSQTMFDELLGIDSACLTKKQIEHYRPLVYKKMAEESAEPLFLKVHDAYTRNREGQPIFPSSATAGAIYLVRNPLDVAVSYAHHRDEPPDETIEHLNCARAFVAGTEKKQGQLPQRLKSWSEHIKSWTNAPDIDVLAVRYEDLLCDTAAVFTDIIRFAKLEFDAERVKKAVAFSDFERLRKQEQARGFGEKQPTAVSFFRKGKSGSWREQLTEAQVKRIIENHREAMRRFGYLSAEDEILL